MRNSSSTDPAQVWVRQLSAMPPALPALARAVRSFNPCSTNPAAGGGTNLAVALFNDNPDSGGTPMDITVSWSEIGLSPGSPAHVRDLWAHETHSGVTGSYTAKGVAPHEAVVLRVWACSTTRNAEHHRARLGRA